VTLTSTGSSRAGELAVAGVGAGEGVVADGSLKVQVPVPATRVTVHTSRLVPSETLTVPDGVPEPVSAETVAV